MTNMHDVEIAAIRAFGPQMPVTYWQNRPSIIGM